MSETHNLRNSPTFMASAATNVQKVYRSYRTRRMLADSAFVAEKLWWRCIDYAQLNHRTTSFYNDSEQELASSRWNRVSLNASKVGKGLHEDANALKLAFQHWIEAIDPRHRYGHNLHMYFKEWIKDGAGQPFFYWLDVGKGKEINLHCCPRSKLQHQIIKYMGPQERAHYEYVAVDGKMVHKEMGDLLHTAAVDHELSSSSDILEASNWIFVMSTSKKLYVGEKEKGRFHHSSFLSGGVTLAAGKLSCENGILKTISAHSGHYRPTDKSIDHLVSFLKENGVNLDQVEISYARDKYVVEEVKAAAIIKQDMPGPKGTVLSDDRIIELPKKAILERINSKKAARSYQLGDQLSLKWSTGAGPRIGWVADYPLQVRQQALEITNLSPRTAPPNRLCF